MRVQLFFVICLIFHSGIATAQDARVVPGCGTARLVLLTTTHAP